MNITELEKDVLQGFQESECMYLEHVHGYTKIVKTKQLSGVISSLIKKGLIDQWIDEEYNMSVVQITEKGKPFTVWSD